MSKLLIEQNDLYNIIHTFDNKNEFDKYAGYTSKISKYFKRLGVYNIEEMKIPLFWFPSIVRFIFRLIKTNPEIKINTFAESGHNIDVHIDTSLSDIDEQQSIREAIIDMKNEINDLNHRKVERWLEMEKLLNAN